MSWRQLRQNRWIFGLFIVIKGCRISVVLQSRIFQFSDSEFKDPIATALTIWKQKFTSAFSVSLEEVNSIFSSMPPTPQFGSRVVFSPPPPPLKNLLRGLWTYCLATRPRPVGRKVTNHNAYWDQKMAKFFQKQPITLKYIDNTCWRTFDTVTSDHDHSGNCHVYDAFSIQSIFLGKNHFGNIYINCKLLLMWHIQSTGFQSHQVKAHYPLIIWVNKR